MHGLGNDFVVIDAVRQQVALDRTLVKRIADRRFGVGCDQVLLVERPSSARADFRYRIFNADGGEVEQCGNGARCFVKFVREKGLTEARSVRVETAGGLITPSMDDDGLVTVDMGRPHFAPHEVPFDAPAEQVSYEILLDDMVIDVSVLSMGNPHVVQIVDDVDRAPVLTQGPKLEHHPRFPERVNAGYMQVIDRANIRLRVWERGAGETPACGTGACAAVVAGVRRGLLDATVDVSTRGGMLRITWRGADEPVTMTGPAATVFEGEWDDS
ncbi:MAG: diaminopimelate epimerase [Pseudomonadota bacterium]|nr:diaminopimelate epimerase [Pseudomonadota bacterium]